MTTGIAQSHGDFQTSTHFAIYNGNIEEFKSWIKSLICNNDNIDISEFEIKLLKELSEIKLEDIKQSFNDGGGEEYYLLHHKDFNKVFNSNNPIYIGYNDDIIIEGDYVIFEENHPTHPGQVDFILGGLSKEEFEESFNSIIFDV